MSEPIETEQTADEGPTFTDGELHAGKGLFELYKQAGAEVVGVPSSATWEDQGDGQKVWARFGQLLETGN